MLAGLSPPPPPPNALKKICFLPSLVRATNILCLAFARHPSSLPQPLKMSFSPFSGKGREGRRGWGHGRGEGRGTGVGKPLHPSKLAFWPFRDVLGKSKNQIYNLVFWPVCKPPSSLKLAFWPFARPHPSPQKVNLGFWKGGGDHQNSEGRVGAGWQPSPSTLPNWLFGLWGGLGKGGKILIRFFGLSPSSELPIMGFLAIRDFGRAEGASKFGREGGGGGQTSPSILPNWLFGLWGAWARVAKS